MNSRVVLWLLLLFSACTEPPAPRKAPEDGRGVWQEKTRQIRNSWSRAELQSFLDSIRDPNPHRVDLLDGGGFSAGTEPMTYFNLYPLDDAFALYVIWEDPVGRQGIRSTEVVGFPDALKRIDPELREAVAAIHRSPSPQRGFVGSAGD